MDGSQNKKRLKLGIIFNLSPHWMGGIVYIINIVKTLDFLEDDEKPEILLFYRAELERFVDEIHYPYLTAIEWCFPSIIKGNIYSFLLGNNIFIEQILCNYSLDAIYPLQDLPVRTRSSVKLVSWCADLQHKHYPEFFSKKQIFARNLRIKLSLRNSNDLVLSSKAVLNDFERFYKLRKGLNIHIFHFVSIIDNLEDVKIEDLRRKYNLPDRYFMVSNQFHRHKNHKVLLLSLAKLKEMGIRKHLAFTGKFPGASDSPYLAELHSIIEDNKLEDQVTLLGVISRSEQLQLMRYSQAVLQPSLFEGWSTVIEDAISLQVPVIASSLAVNIEQLGNRGTYFEPHDYEKLAELLYNYPDRNYSDVFYEDYTERIRKAAKVFINIFKG